MNVKNKIVLCIAGMNEAEWLPYSIGSVYDVVDSIIFVEGAIDGWFPTPHSTDDTMEVVRGLDKDNKITIVQTDGYWKNLEHQKQTFCEKVEIGSFMLINDADEIYNPEDIVAVRKILDARPDLTQVIPIFKEHFGDFKHLLTPEPGVVNLTNCRCIKMRAGDHFSCNHPTLHNSSHQDLSINDAFEDERVVIPDWFIHHFAYCKPREYLIDKHVRYDVSFNSTPPPIARMNAEERYDNMLSMAMDYDGPVPKILESHPLWGKDIVGSTGKHWLGCMEYRKPECVPSPYNTKYVKPPKVSVVITAYNNSSILATTLPHWGLQTYTNFEVLVVDDGSGEVEAAAIKSMVEEYGYKYYYNDSGDVYSISSARNIGIWKSGGERILFTDSDMIPDPDMIMEHIMEAQPRNITVGCRHKFDPHFPDNDPLKVKIIKYTHRVGDTGSGIDIEWEDGDESHAWDVTLDPRIEGGFKAISEGRSPDPWEHVHGCNFSVHRQRLIDMNGFDEDYDSRWGGEDTDVAIRLIRRGLTVVPVTKSMGFHIDHPSLEREGQRDLLNRKMGEDPVRAVPKSWTP